MRYRLTIFLLLFSFLGSVAYGQSLNANFSTNGSSGCSPLIVKFQDASSGNPSSWQWDLGNGSTSTKQNPTASYFTPGVYPIQLTVTNSSGNSSTKTGSITVYESPNPEFLSDKQSGCFPVFVQFSDKSKPVSGYSNVSWQWDFGNGTQATSQNAKATYRSAGDFTVYFKVTNDKGCSKTITKINHISITPGVSIGFNNTQPTVCNVPYNITFNNTTSGPGTITYNWDFGDGNTSTLQNPTNAYKSDGTFPVTLIATSNLGCSDTLRNEKAVIIPKTKTDFIIPDTICVNKPLFLFNSTDPEPESSVWTFSDGTTINGIDATKTFSTTGTYTIKLTNTFLSCTSDITKTLVIANMPKPDFSAPITSSCKSPLTVSFSNTSQNGIAFKWDFGDGSSSAATNPSHTYTSPGEYNVKLIAFNNTGCSDTITKSKYIKIKQPNVSFTNLPAGGCVPYSIQPQVLVEAISAISSYKWDFGDGTTSTSQNPTHTYDKIGTYSVSVSLVTSEGCTVNYTLPNAVKVGDKPKPAFTADPLMICADLSVNFTNQSQPISPNVIFTWEFGDGGTSMLTNPSYNYSDTGWFQVKLIMDNNGCKDSVSSIPKYVHKLPPVSRFSLIPDCNKPLTYGFKDESIFDAESVGKRTWEWVFPDGSKSNLQNPPPYNFPGTGTYSVSLTTSNGTCTHTLKKNVVINDNTPDFITYNKSGDCQPIYSGIRVSAKNQQDIVDYKWEIEGNTYHITNTNEIGYNFYNPGNVMVKVTTTDKFGCTYSTAKPIFIGGLKAGFSEINAQGCLGLTATFIDSSKTDGTSNIVSWKWNFGDRTPLVDTTAGTIKHAYTKKGTFTPKLIVRNSLGCVDSISYENKVKISVLTADFEFTPKACLGSPINFINKSLGNYTTSVWNFGDGAPPVTDASGQYLYKDTGLYDLKLMVKDAFDCKDSIQKLKAIQISKPVAAFDVNDSISFCPPFEVQFTNKSKFVGDLDWTFLNYGTSKEVDPKIVLTNPATYNVKLKVLSPDRNCADSTYKNITLYNKQDAALMYNPLSACIPGTVNLSAFGKLSSANFFWDFGDGNILDTAVNEATHVYTDFGTFTPKIILTESSGCVIPIAGAEPIKIHGVKTKFNIDKFFFCDSGYVKAMDSTVFNEPIASYNWDFGDGTINNSQTPPTHRYTSPGIYPVSLTVKTVSGCSSTMQLKVPVKIVESPLISISGDSVICINEFIRHSGVFERSDSSIVRWAWQFPNGNKASVQIPAQQRYGTAGNFLVSAIATNTSGCADTVIKRILVNPLPTVTLPAIITKQAGYPVTIPATYTSNVINYTWTPATGLSCTDCPEPEVTTKFDTKYYVNFVDSNGCKNKGEVQIIVICKNANIFIPNTFSPNADGSNDVFYVRGKGLERVKSLRIFNRWGEIVFEKRDFSVNDPTVGWDGRYKGAKPQADVYVYQVEVFCENSQIIRFDGNIALIQ